MIEMNWLGSILGQQGKYPNRSSPPPKRAEKVRFTSAPKQLRHTIRQIGQAIERGSHYVPLIHHARGVASRAGPKDYKGQVDQLYYDFVNRWRYVKDPPNLELLHVSGPQIFGQIYGFDRRLPERGSGDCDESASAIGSALRSIGLPVQLVTTAPPQGSPSLFTHVFARTHIPGVGWYSVDPVGWPKYGPGWTPPHNRIAFWNLKGNLLGYKGQFPKSFTLSGETQGGIEMNNYQGLGDFADHGLSDWAGDGEPLDWAVYGLRDFGAYVPQMGAIPGDQTQLLMEYTDDDEIEYPGYMGLVRTKMLEMDPIDYELVRRFGAPRMGSVALADDGDVYQYTKDPDTGLGFFKKLFKKVGGAIKKGVKWVGGKAKKLISKLPGGKYLVKLYGKLHKTAMKLVRPLTKFLGSKLAKRIAPIASLIPGYGPVVAAALTKGGEIVKLLKETGVTTDKAGKPKFKSKDQAKKFASKLKKLAKLKQRQLRSKQKSKRRIPRGFSRGGRLLKAGTPEHKAYLRGLGLDVDDIGLN